MQATGVGVAGLTAGNIVQGQYEASWDNPDDVLDLLFLGGVEDGATHYSEDLLKIIAPYLLERGVKAHYTERQDDLNSETLSNYDAVMLYGNRLDPTEEQIDALVDFVEDGGGFLPIHSASASFQSSDRFIDLVGGSFQTHGSGEMTTDRIVSDHPIFEGAEPIESPWEETYQHTNVADDIEVLAYGAGHSDYEDIDEPFTWVREQGDGRVFYTAWGHDERTWELDGFQQLLHNAIRWASGNEDTIGSHPELDEVSYSNVSTEYGHDEVPYYQGDAPDAVSSGDDGVWDLVQDPMSVSDSVTRTITPAEFEMEYFVSEDTLPDGVEGQILDMTFDAAGRCWISVTKDYPNDGGTGEDSIVICEDTDGDGIADEFSIFKEDLSIPHSLIPHEDGVIAAEVGVDEEGRVVYFGDEDGDDEADVEDVIFTGYGTGDTHAGLNQLHRGVDNWIYGVVGYNGLNPSIDDSVSFSQELFRFKPDGSEIELVGDGASNMAGVKSNEEGLVFCSSATAGDNVTTYAAIPDKYYEYINGYNGFTTIDIRGQNHSRTEDENRILPINERYRQVDQHTGFTAASDQEIYTAREFPEQYWNSTTFVGEGTGQLLATFYLEQEGAGYNSVYHHNLVASDDEWFSPTYANTGPDGMVWMIDFYNFIFQHNPDAEEFGYEMGEGNAYESNVRDAGEAYSRLYRVTTDGDADPHSTDLSDASPDELVDALTDDNKFWRQTAQRLLVERGETDVVDDLVDLVQDNSTDEIGLNPGAIHALWTLDGLDAIDEAASDGDSMTHRNPAEMDDVDDSVDHVIQWQGGSDDDESETVDVLDAVYDALTHESAGVRLNALRVLPGDEQLRDAILENDLLEDDDGRVQMWALLTLAETPESEAAGEAVFEMIDDEDRLDDDLLVDAATISAATHATGFISAYEAEYGDPDEQIEGVNVLENSDIETVEMPAPDGWSSQIWGGDAEFTYTGDESYSGERSIRIDSESGLDGAWNTTVEVEPDTEYTLSGMIKTENVDAGTGNGAQLNVHELGQDSLTDSVTGTEDWTEVSITINSDDNEQLQINGLLGGWGESTGTAWFDDLAFEGPDGENLLSNGDFGAGTLEPSPANWGSQTWEGDGEFAVTSDESSSGDYSVRINSESGVDGAWNQAVEVEPNKEYTLVGRIKTESVDAGSGNGAQLNVHELGEESATDAVTGTTDWTQVSTTVNSGDNEEFQINGLLGGWGESTGTAWFDDIQLIDPEGEEEEAPNLIPNPTFDGDDEPDEWGPRISGGEAELSRDEEITHSGDYSLRIDSEEPFDGSWAIDIPTEANVTYEIGGYVRTENFDAGSGYGAGFGMASLGEQTLTDMIEAEETDGWVEVSGTFTASGSQETFLCLMGGWGSSSGTAWWDEPYVRVLEDVGEGIDAIYNRVQQHLEDEDDDDEESEALDPEETIELGGQMGGWLGQAPENIEDENNPTIRLVEDEEYTIEWTNLDGVDHNLELTDSPDWGQGEVLESTDFSGEEGETLTLTFTASADLAGYDCNPHGEMSGEIEIVEE